MRSPTSHLAATVAVLILALPFLGARADAGADVTASLQPATPESLYARLAALAPSGHAEVKYNLGMFLNNGIGTPPDRAAAFRQFSQAAEAGHALAAYKVGCYFAGQFPGVVPTDPAQALRFKLRAAEAGYELAQTDVGTHFARLGDTAQAALWWERASRQGSLEATARLAHALSIDGSADKVRAVALMRLVKTMTSTPPQPLLARLDALEAQLSDADKAAATTIGATWLQGKTPLTAQAQRGFAAVPALLASLEAKP